MNISINELKEGLNINHRKDNKFTNSSTIVSFETGKGEEYNKGFSQPLSVRWYSTSATTYCCIWGSIKSVHFTGSGKASGYGYNRSSAAFSQALTNAGFNVESLAGTGENDLAINKVAELMELENYTIVDAHG